jgi:hypothetical protein
MITEARSHFPIRQIPPYLFGPEGFVVSYSSQFSNAKTLRGPGSSTDEAYSWTFLQNIIQPRLFKPKRGGTPMELRYWLPSD